MKATKAPDLSLSTNPSHLAGRRQQRRRFIHMEVGSSSPSSAVPPARRGQSPQIADRIVRALTHRLRLLHRSGHTFFVLGATGNVYTVSISASGASCTCPDRTTPCKHILFVFLRVLCLPADDPCLHRRTLRPCHVSRLLNLPTSPVSLAGARAREHFHRLFFSGDVGGEAPAVAAGERRARDGASCPVCLEELVAIGDGGGEEQRVVTCRTCENSVHEECFEEWRRSRGRRPASCVVCRARWRRERKVAVAAEKERYVNLAAVAVEDDDDEDVGNIPAMAVASDCGY